MQPAWHGCYVGQRLTIILLSTLLCCSALGLGEFAQFAVGKDAVVFLSLGGEMGRNGKLQSFLSCQQVPYTGPGFVSTMLCSDKVCCLLCVTAS